MVKVSDPNNRYFGKLCKKHPEQGGLRQKANATCIQCGRDASRARLDKKRSAAGKVKLVPMSKDAAKEKIRLRDLARNKIRRLDPRYIESQIERKRVWRDKNKNRHIETSRAYDAYQLMTNPQRRIAKNLRNRLRKAMLGKTRGVSAVGDLGMSIAAFRLYFETLFSDGMGWENYGDWHIDHIRPLDAFDLTDLDQAKAACHFTNLQPLWALENMKKANKITRGFV